ncbi:MAG: tRNA glutamyl-Q(34) synthetase GluQRS [Christensenellaceae bacterium]|nr:tRNA glutamyl-Q(34) synthetase GluQRS [Christensenellaceae bacterium]
MHLGNVFCALLAWLFAKKQGGSMVLRMEDLDPARSRSEYADLLEDDLNWLGLNWDEGGSLGGPHGPYYQSACTPIYEEAFARLKEAAHIFPCFCSRDQLHAAGAPHASDGTLLYPGTCRQLTAEEIAEKSLSRRPAMRIAAPEECMTFTDGLYGEYSEVLSRQCGDFILRRSDGVFAYQLAVVVDDARMGITQVVRGKDLLSSTPRQLWLYRLLGLTPPRFTHIPLLLAEDGRRLSKREKDLDMGALRSRFSPEELTGKLAFLAGLTEDPSPLSVAELLEKADLSRLTKRDIVVPKGLFE